MKPKVVFILTLSFFQISGSTIEYDYDYIDSDESKPTEINNFVYNSDNYDVEEHIGSHEPSEYYYDDTPPFGELEDTDTITIEQFVNELKRRKQAKEHQKQKQVNKGIKGTQSAPKRETNKNITEKKEQAKDPQKQKSSTSSRPKKSKSQSQRVTKRKQKKQNSNVAGPKKNRKANKQKPRGPNPTKTKKQLKPNLSIKSKVVAKPSRKQKPFHKPRKDTKQKVKDEEDEDPFQIGNSDSHQHSDHHIHQHDHLEAHKHHHKHKESHSHSHDHSNDHIHNHKHTHNHEHNHIHKHNEAHEHTAEHAHTEKHHHKHLEYIDAGGWRRRNDEYSDTMQEDEPSVLILEERGFKESDPKDNVKSYLKKFIESYKTAASPEAEVEHNKASQNVKEKEPDVISEKPATFSQHNWNADSEDIGKEIDDFHYDQEEPFMRNHPGSESINHQEMHVESADDLTYEDNFALGNTEEESDQEYADYNAGYGVKFANEYDNEEYSEYDD